jgi:hypothetical protein
VQHEERQLHLTKKHFRKSSEPELSCCD